MLFLWLLIAFLSGALPLSVWVGRFGLGVDIRQYGDGNPGATNVGRAGGRPWYMLALMLDILKGVLPVGTAHWIFGVGGWEIVLIGIMPSLGHAFSPFLGFDGGKALATSFGVWIGLTLNFTAAVALGALVLWYLLLDVEGWSVMMAVFTLALYLQLVHPDTGYVWLALMQSVLLAWKHRADLRRRPGLRPAVRRRLPL